MVSHKSSLIEQFSLNIIIEDVLETSNLKKMQRKPFYLRSNFKRIFGGTPGEKFLLINVKYYG